MPLSPLPLAFLALAFLAGCDSRADRSDAVAEGFPAPSFWQVEALDGVPVPDAGDAEKGTVRFSADGVSGVGGCNGYGGSYTAQAGGAAGDAIQIRRLTATEMYCGDDLHPFEERFFEALAGAQRWGLADDGTLRLTGSASSVVLSQVYQAY